MQGSWVFCMNFTGCLSGTLSVCTCNPSGLQRQCLLPCHDGEGQVLVSGGRGRRVYVLPPRHLRGSIFQLARWLPGHTKYRCRLSWIWQACSLGWQNKVTSDLAEGPVGSFTMAYSFIYICPWKLSVSGYWDGCFILFAGCILEN